MNKESHCVVCGMKIRNVTRKGDTREIWTHVFGRSDYEGITQDALHPAEPGGEA